MSLTGNVDYRSIHQKREDGSASLQDAEVLLLSRLHTKKGKSVETYKNLKSFPYKKRFAMRLIHFTIPVMVLILLSMFVTAVDESPIMDGSQSTILADDDLFKPLADLIRPIFTKINVIVGGLFGLYIILIIIRAYY